MASSVVQASPVNILSSLPPRPPTPPREASRDLDASLSSLPSHTLSFDPCTSLQTPPGTKSPIVLTASRSGTSIQVRKRVGWSAHTEYKDPPDYALPVTATRPPSHLSAPSPVPNRPIKGILKPAPSQDLLPSSHSHQLLDGPVAPQNIIQMLDSTIKQLAGPDRDSKLDAYMVLSRALKASDNLPDRVALLAKMSLFMHFIERDVTSKTDTGALDTSLVNHALTLLATFLHFPAIASTLTNDFGLFLMDHAIRSFEDVAMPKDVIRHLMQVVALQNFSAKVMTPDRAGRLIAALHRMEDHLTGKSIIMSRLYIYKRLVKQTRASMVAHSDWMMDLFSDMLSTVRDIRTQAISLGTESGFALRSEKAFFRKAAEVFKKANQNEAYIDFYIKSLQAMIRDKQLSSAVPQILAVVILFLPCPLDHWQYYGPWLSIAQSAFNSTDLATKQEANYAWSRYSCLSLLDNDMPPKAIATLCQPLLSQLRRRVNPRHQEETAKLRTVVIGAICSLYYHVLAQGEGKYPIDLIWDLTVQPAMEMLISLDGTTDAPQDCTQQAARILTGLLDVSTPRAPRKVDSAMDLTVMKKPEDLLPIDPKWVRKHSEKVLQLVGPILEKMLAEMADTDSLAYKLWQSLIGSVAAASAKDIKVSEDTVKFLAASFSLLSKIWSRGGVETKDGGKEEETTAKLPLSGVRNFVSLLIEGLGILPFAERKLSMGRLNQFTFVATPSQRPDRSEQSGEVVRTPLHHLFFMLGCPPCGVTDDEELATMFQLILQPFFHGKSPKARSELALELLRVLPRSSSVPFGAWLLAADAMAMLMDSSPSGQRLEASGEGKAARPEYHDAVVLLEHGLACHPNLPIRHWRSLFHKVSKMVVRDMGVAGHALVLVEPLSHALLDLCASEPGRRWPRIIPATTILFEVETTVKDGELARAAEGTELDVSEALLKLGNCILDLSYDEYYQQVASVETGSLLEAVTNFLRQSPGGAVARVLAHLQQGLCRWLRDERRLCQSTAGLPAQQAICKLWNLMRDEHFSMLDAKDGSLIERYATASMESNHEDVSSSAARFWNSISPARSRVDGKAMESSEASRGGEGSESKGMTAVPPIPKRTSSRRRRVVASGRGLTTEAANRVSTPRHEKGPVQFAAAPASSPLYEKRQGVSGGGETGLGERQIRAPSGIDSRQSPSLASCGEAERQHREAVGEGPRSPSKETTPTRSASLKEPIRSTPTPRRGQELPVDDGNDPPSSPPVPRPCPLLSEIQQRSREERSLEKWEFSSPAGSPEASRGRKRRIAEVNVSLEATDDSVGARTRGATRKQRVAGTVCQDREAVGAARSRSKEGDEKPGESGRVPTMSGAAVESPSSTFSRDATSTASAPARGRLVQKQGEWAKGEKNLEGRATRRRGPMTRKACLEMGDDSREAAGEEPRKVLGDASGGGGRGISEAESKAAGVVAAEAADGHLGGRRTKRKRPSKRVKVSTEADGQVSLRNDQQSGHSLSASLSPRSISETASRELMEKGTRRKRKRGGCRTVGVDAKRRRSEEKAEADATARSGEGEEEEEGGGGGDEEADEEGGGRLMDGQRAKGKGRLVENAKRRRARGQGGGMVTRSSARGERLRSGSQCEAEAGGGEAESGAVVGEWRGVMEGGDTDEELLSQLVTESNAASQQSQARRRSKREGQRSGLAMDGEAKEEDGAMEGGHAEDEAEADGQGIMERLRSGLEELRRAALGRKQVYEMEDVLMDLKRELFEAERRGRRTGGGGKRKG